MSVQHEDAGDAPSVPPALDLAAGARELIRGLHENPWGQVSPSVYETGRLVTLAPWLAGHRERLRFLLASQRSDGAWGALGGYSLVPTLSATEGILSELRNRNSDIDDHILRKAADHGLQALTTLLEGVSSRSIPDMPAVELISAHLTCLINDHLAGPDGTSPGPPELRPAGFRLRVPGGWDESALEPLRARLSEGRDVPEKLLHALEIAGPAAHRTGSTRPGSRTGGVGASPAATAAWLGPLPPPPGDPARRFLETVAEQHGGPVPCGFPITVFERSWVLTGLIRAGVPVRVPSALATSLAAEIGPAGTPAGEGLPADADTTSVALHALTLLGSPMDPDCLLAFELDDRFCTWQGEQGASVTTNAHVLDALGEFVQRHPGACHRYAPAMAKASNWLRAQQHPDGSWTDRWHASPYYATSCAVQALRRFAGVAARDHVRRAERWVMDTQRGDGSWGRWVGTAEETAEAMLVLTAADASETGAVRHPSHVQAIAQGRDWLLRAPDWTDGPALWHDKDLYLPKAIVRSTVLSALHLARSRRR
ncbi:prenyltransferase/squalene oxidase repeat-containing protein [Actinomadura sp. 7K507]|uniref:prenyltransferase/squalene oxidase repeat-containing protein n=1 Tax=Actinomadura sp. 7K507 TaxID=2530365 RepID=UPI0010505028|nr:prenyltransferase/squalene oxidase repeat-containing protein [Actinomadura sp. 7K507]TDC92219.1 hypothetical protein E1285_11905 [Actinomadura sp. 7K507]